VLLPIGLTALHPAVLGRVRSVVVRLIGRGAGVPLPEWRATATVVLRYVPAWLFIWAATWLVARALVPDPPILRIGIATTLSWVAGFVAVPVPAGAGVREAVFVASSGMAGGVAATVAIASRLAFVLVDVAGLVLTAHWHRASPRNEVP
jgi:glycosyltransferase 2 family protein